MDSSPSSSLRAHGISIGDAIVVCRDGTRKWRPAEVATVEEEHRCEVIYEDGEREWVLLDKVKYMLKRSAGERSSNRGNRSWAGDDCQKGEKRAKIVEVVEVDMEEEDNKAVVSKRFENVDCGRGTIVAPRLRRKCRESSVLNAHVDDCLPLSISSDMLNPVRDQDVLVSSDRRSARLKRDMESCTEMTSGVTKKEEKKPVFGQIEEKKSGENNLIGCRRSNRLQKKMTLDCCLSSNSLERKSSVPACSPGHITPYSDESGSNEESVSDVEFCHTSESSSEEYCSSDTSVSSFSQTQNLRNRGGSWKVSRGSRRDREVKDFSKYCGSYLKKTKSSDMDGAEYVKRKTVIRATGDDDGLDKKNGGSLNDGFICSICQARATGTFLVQCIGAGCLRAFHAFCVIPPVQQLEKDWLCPYCKEESLAMDNSIKAGLIQKKLQKIVGCRRVSAENGKMPSQVQYLLKWQSLSHHYDSWVPVEWLYATHRVQLFSYQRKNRMPKEVFEIDQRKPEWFDIDRVIACRKKGCSTHLLDTGNSFYLKQPNGGFEFLVKWRGLDYCDATWESTLTEELLAKVDGFILRHQRTSDRIDNCDLKCSIYNFHKTPGYLDGVLYEYQLEGLNWILSNFMDRRSVILADEMGLGKTIQVVSFIQSMKQENLNRHPVLIISPKSVLFHWEKEFQRWARNLNVVIYQGDRESRKYIQLYEFCSSEKNVLFDALVTNYELVLLDNSILKKFMWSAVIIDEGHKIKNLKCKLASCLKHCTSDFRLLLTGTPLQNTLLELFALLHFLDPKEFADPEAEAEKFSRLGTGWQSEEALKIAELHELLRTRMLRRMKSDVLPGCIPAKKWIEVPCSLTDVQRELYVNILERNYQKLNEGIQGGKKVVLNFILMQLRKCCNHPYIFPGQEQCDLSKAAALNSLIASSGKLQLLQKLLPKLKERGNRVLLFSQMTTMLDILEDFLSFLGLLYFRIDGSTSISTRQQQMKEFNDPDSKVFVFLISTRAGGLGIDLPTADRVIIYDPDFNPFMDLQAQSRAHRIGQTRAVVVYQLITKYTVEEKILEKSKKKLAVENLVMNRKLKPDAKELHSVLLHGARIILSPKDKHATTVNYDDAAIESLLKLDPARDEKCASEDNGYLGGIQSFSAAIDEPPSPTARDWEEILGPVEDLTNGNLGRGKRQKKEVKYNENDDNDENDDDDIYSPESSSFSASSEGSELEELGNEPDC